jgi:signal transduction histidine kinase
MSRLRTLRGRLTAFALLAATVAVALVIVAFNLVLADSLRGDVDSRLRTQAAAAATTVRAVDGTLQVRESPDDQALDAELWILDRAHAVVRPSGPAATLQRAADAMAGRPRGFDSIGDEPAVRLYALPLTHDGARVGTVVAGESLAAYDRTTDIARVGTIALGLLLLAAVYAVTWLTIGRALRPVAEMTRTAAEWSDSEPHRRFGPEPRPDELGQLAATFDALLDRLASSLRHEQRLSAELSHELRTPLARIVAELELLQRRERSDDDRRAAYEVIGRSAEQMQGILETLMAAARAESSTHRGRSALAPTFAALAEEWTPALAQRGVALDVVPAGDAAVGVDADVLERVVAPLLDNAGRFARSRVSVEALRNGSRVLVRVRDDGPGLAAGEAETVFEPGARGTQANGHAGAGLGLALARRLARAAGGDVTADPAGEAGATFLIDLPA